MNSEAQRLWKETHREACRAHMRAFRERRKEREKGIAQLTELQLELAADDPAMTYDEIAIELSVSPQAVRQIVLRALRKLRSRPGVGALRP